MSHVPPGRMNGRIFRDTKTKFLNSALILARLKDASPEGDQEPLGRRRRRRRCVKKLESKPVSWY